MSIIGTIHEDVTADVLGNMGPWQRLVLFTATVFMTNSFFIHDEDIYLIHPTSSYVICIPPEKVKISDIYNETLCTYTLANGNTDQICEKWFVKLLWIFWMRKNWIIFCDDKMKLLLTAVIYRLARVFGFVIYGLIADSFGRRKAIIMDIFGAFVLRLVITFCDYEGWFRLFIFLLSLLSSANVYMGLVIICEIASNKWRSTLSFIAMSPRLCAAVLSISLATSAPNPETYNLLASFLSIFYMVLLKWTPESPQWLLYNRKIHLAERVIYKAAQQNNINFSAEFKIRPVNHRAYGCLDETTLCLRMISTHNIRVIISISLVFWALFYFLWGSLYLKIYLSGIDKSHMLLKIACFFTILAIIGWCLLKKLLLLHLLVINVSLTGFFNAVVMIFKQPSANEWLSAIALASGLMVHALILNITPRLYAINVRATLFGCCHAVGQLGALLSYIFVIYNTMNDVTYIALEVIIAIILVGVSFMFPHVDGRELPDVMEDMDYFCELTKPLRWASQRRSSPSKEEVEMRIHSFASARATSTASDATSLSLPAAPPRPIGLRRLWQRINKYMLEKRGQALRLVLRPFSPNNFRNT